MNGKRKSRKRGPSPEVESVALRSGAAKIPLERAIWIQAIDQDTDLSRAVGLGSIGSTRHESVHAPRLEQVRDFPRWAGPCNLNLNLNLNLPASHHCPFAGDLFHATRLANSVFRFSPL
jgi:hypothetical protein